MPFAWGKHDCCIFAAGAVAEMTGVEMVEAPDYTTALGAARALGRLGHRDVVDLASAYLRPWQSLLMARRGDIAALDAGQGLSLGVVLGASVAAPGEQGLIFFPLNRAVKAWRAGD